MTAAESRTAARNQTSDVVSAEANKADNQFHAVSKKPRGSDLCVCVCTSDSCWDCKVAKIFSYSMSMKFIRLIHKY